ncbi:long-chain acyl-CoA synthetase [Desulfatibacillum alkenivorans DSM 16219]|jgi:long-chain acyl-CoA synthetase|uniref:Long-chain-fatty-acid--CoA ligase n=1 Tax=Desulfatibacillum alkenivorans DSM 16219 TaxID=1121393 RepID=A0A1M6J2D3_9BACT|nr:AMP-binding protein [Desulfatibacillum alkenivorans]SHJ40848.1 long-chain acyl-CoA synthetase [Desulfatibacillum alkenivorans DSM 16219]
MEKIWLKNYQDGVPEEIDLSEYSSIPDIMDQAYAKYGPKPAFHQMGKSITYDELNELSKKFASFLQNDLGLKQGARVALMMPNILQYPIALFGILRAGMVAVNVNPLYTARELEHQLNDSGAEAILIFANSASVLQQVLGNTPVKHVLITEIGDMLGFPKSLLVNTVIKRVKKMVPPFSLPSAMKFKAALAKGNSATYKPAKITLDDLAFLQYTGGTTGVSKGAELTHRNIVANVLQARAWISGKIEDGKEIMITPLPLYHIFSLTANCLTFSSIGALNVLITNPRDIPGFVKELNKWKFTSMTGVNTLFNALINDPEFAKVDFSSFKLALGGGMAVQEPVALKWKEITGKPLVEAYGLTETSPAASINRMDLKAYNGYIGLPISSTLFAIRDDDGNDLPLNEVGEICIKGPQVFRGYYKRPEETEKAFWSDGFFKTGDMGFMTEEGFIKLVDRKKDMILVSGFNVYPNEIEDVVAGHPKVLECAAVGVPDAKSGELVKLFVVKKDASLTEEELKAFCKENFTGYKVPKFYEFRDELPKTNVGKILRKDLRQ